MHQLVNGSHFSKVVGYFEWWYFHFATTAGFYSNIVLHETDIFGLKKSPYISMSFQFPHREPQYLRMTISDGSIAKGSEYLSQSDGFFRESASEVEIDITFSSEKTFEVVITKLAKSLMFNDCILYQEGDKRNYWRLQVPLGRFNGVLKIKGDKYPVEGVAYHDHQWGNISIQDFVSDWVWGHFSSKESSAVFFVIQTQESDLIERYVVVSPYSVQSSVNHGQVPHLVKLAKSSSPELWKSKPVVTFPFGTTLKTKVSPNILLRSRINEVHTGFMITYLRWTGDAILSSSNSFLYGITEYIRVRKET